MKVLAVALTVALVTAGCHGEKTLWLENDTGSTIVIYGTAQEHVLAPGEALDIGTVSFPGIDEFLGKMDGSPIRIVVDTGAIDGYADPARPREYRLPISRFVQVK